MEYPIGLERVNKEQKGAFHKIFLNFLKMAISQFFNSPEPKAQGELIVWDSSWRPSGHTFKHEYL